MDFLTTLAAPLVDFLKWIFKDRPHKERLIFGLASIIVAIAVSIIIIYFIDMSGFFLSVVIILLLVFGLASIVIVALDKFATILKNRKLTKEKNDILDDLRPKYTILLSRLSKKGPLVLESAYASYLKNKKIIAFVSMSENQHMYEISDAFKNPCKRYLKKLNLATVIEDYFSNITEADSVFLEKLLAQVKSTKRITSTRQEMESIHSETLTVFLDLGIVKSEGKVGLQEFFTIPNCWRAQIEGHIQQRKQKN